MPLVPPAGFEPALTV